ncbi:ABC transporter permease [methanotrophic endosymbiont of Bathymodiolus puteoserpentis (Logatchev)]|jgi:ABC-2 type transport system permease protein|uniref:ABC transporter permease n=1 Tax=methanotrophic endosymbiont of Bathymodiolus puteoserpentis (Logatchev) TaxID=343235 RepID=UPI0013CBAF47|nr:ABC transporter permease [methanotrophic endosymbiont of Bathymodiolus puteoserpentis (Logatchev)]SHE19526.1 ABC transport system, permease component YbhS [methanotrophic endosymbiont of Bathymodiolus puteoserpentis (Logatchev)]
MNHPNKEKYMRLQGLIIKEFLQIRRDPSSLGIAFAMPVFLLLLFGYGVSLDAKHVPVGIVLEKISPEARSFSAAFEHSEYFVSIHFANMKLAQQALEARKISAIIRLRSNFNRQLYSHESAPIQVIVDGVDANTARLISGYIQGTWNQWLIQFAAQRGISLTQPIMLEQRIWYNSAVRSRNFLVPGLIAVIMTLIGALLTALVMAREWERGTLEALIATPVSVTEILLGKLIPYYLLGMGGMLLSIAMAVFLFQVPLLGSLWVLLITGTLFMLVALGMGLVISIAAKNQFVAGQIAIIITFLPAFIMSGFIFDIDSMPPAIQSITYLIAARYFVAILQTVFLAGNVWGIIIPNALALLFMALFFFALALRRMPRRLE